VRSHRRRRPQPPTSSNNSRRAVGFPVPVQVPLAKQWARAVACLMSEDARTAPAGRSRRRTDGARWRACGVAGPSPETARAGAGIWRRAWSTTARIQASGPPRTQPSSNRRRARYPSPAGRSRRAEGASGRYPGPGSGPRVHRHDAAGPMPRVWTSPLGTPRRGTLRAAPGRRSGGSARGRGALERARCGGFPPSASRPCG
jgi:hypothetical protein